MPDLLVELRDRVLYLTLNRPDKLNAMSTEIVNGLGTELLNASHDSKWRGRADRHGPRILLGRRYHLDARA